MAESYCKRCHGSGVVTWTTWMNLNKFEECCDLCHGTGMPPRPPIERIDMTPEEYECYISTRSLDQS